MTSTMTPEDVVYLLSPKAIREQCARVMKATQEGRGLFEYDESRFDWTVNKIIETTKSLYPDLNIPYHSRWGHFKVGKIDRLHELDEEFQKLSLDDRAVTLIDLVVVSVLLDAGAGNAWSFLDRHSHKRIGRSEGLALASLEMFRAGAFSSHKNQPLRVDADALMSLTVEQLAIGFQVSETNPLVGLEGRVGLLRSLGAALKESRETFGTEQPRPGNMFKYLKAPNVRAVSILQTILLRFGSIWPGRLSVQGINLGDVWACQLLGGDLVPFHKLSQWLSYSMIEAFEQGGVKVTGLNDLTGLAEYRNGGLMIDSGLLKPKDPACLTQAHLPSSELIIQWRALTVTLLDRLAEAVRNKLQKTAEEFPLVKVLEGGTWWTGRRLAAEFRPQTSAPPLQVQSDGTVF